MMDGRATAGTTGSDARAEALVASYKAQHASGEPTA
jgi:hypothetical protein